jgi:hypothetical protein
MKLIANMVLGFSTVYLNTLNIHGFTQRLKLYFIDYKGAVGTSTGLSAGTSAGLSAG